MPSAPFLVPPLLLVVVLAISGVAKLRDPSDTSAVFAKLRLPAVLTRIKAPALLPYGELALALLLLFLPDGWYVVATTAAVVLFGIYVWVVARALRFDHPIMCGCFGRLGLGWITPQTVVRNSVLLGVAVIAWVDSWRGHGVLQRLSHLGTQAWWLVAVLVAMVTTTLVVRESKLPNPRLDRLDDDGRYVPRPVPYSLLDGPDGPATLWSLTDTAARFLVFWNPVDASTAVVADRLSAWQEQLAPVMVHLVARSEWSQAVAVRPDLADALLGDPDGHTQQLLGAYTQPSAVLLGTDRLLAGGPASGVDEIDELVAAAAEELHAAAAAVAVPEPSEGVAN